MKNLTLELINQIKNFKLNGAYADSLQTKQSRYRFKIMADKIIFENNITFLLDKKQTKKRVFCEEEKAIMLLEIKNIHYECHFGRDRLYDLCKQKFFNVKREDVADIIRECIQCQSKRLLCTKPQIKPIIAKEPRDRYIADLIDLTAYKDKNNGFGWLLVCIDSFSKFVAVKCLKKKCADEVCYNIEKIFLQIGPPFILHTDYGKEFKNKILESMCIEYDVKKVFGRARVPCIQGQVERLNQSIKRWISESSASAGDLGRCLLFYQKLFINIILQSMKQLNFGLFISSWQPKDLMKPKKVKSVHY